MAKGKVSPVKPGEKVAESGIYQGNKSGKKVTLDKNEIAPPTPYKGEKWKAKIITNPKNK